MARPSSYDDQLRARLVEVTADTIARSGTEALSLRRLAAAAGTSTNAIYALFGSKPELVAAVVAEGLSSFGAAQAAALDPRRDSREDAVALGHAYRDWALDHPALYMVMFGGRTVPKDRTAPGAAPVPGITPLVSAVERLVADGVVDGDSVPEVAWTIWSVAHGMVSLEIAEGMPRRVERRAVYDRALRVILDGWTAQVPRG